MTATVPVAAPRRAGVNVNRGGGEEPLPGVVPALLCPAPVADAGL